MGAVFLAAMFLPYVGERAVIGALLTGLAWAILYAFEWFGVDRVIFGEKAWWTSISPLLLLPGSFLVTAAAALVLGLLVRDSEPAK